MNYFPVLLLRKITSAKMEKICWQNHFAAWMQPLQYDLRSSAAKDKSITYAAAASSNFDAAIPMRSAETELQNTIELRAMASEIAAPKPDLDAKATKRRFWSTFKRNFKRKIISAKIEKICWQIHFRSLDAAIPIRFTIFSCKRQRVLRMQPLHQATLTQPLQCDLQRLSSKTQ